MRSDDEEVAAVEPASGSEVIITRRKGDALATVHNAQLPVDIIFGEQIPFLTIHTHSGLIAIGRRRSQQHNGAVGHHDVKVIRNLVGSKRHLHTLLGSCAFHAKHVECLCGLGLGLIATLVEVQVVHVEHLITTATVKLELEVGARGEVHASESTQRHVDAVPLLHGQGAHIGRSLGRTRAVVHNRGDANRHLGHGQQVNVHIFHIAQVNINPILVARAIFETEVVEAAEQIHVITVNSHLFANGGLSPSAIEDRSNRLVSVAVNRLHVGGVMLRRGSRSEDEQVASSCSLNGFCLAAVAEGVNCNNTEVVGRVAIESINQQTSLFASHRLANGMKNGHVLFALSILHFVSQVFRRIVGGSSLDSHRFLTYLTGCSSAQHGSHGILHGLFENTIHCKVENLHIIHGCSLGAKELHIARVGHGFAFKVLGVAVDTMHMCATNVGGLTKDAILASKRQGEVLRASTLKRNRHTGDIVDAAQVGNEAHIVGAACLIVASATASHCPLATGGIVVKSASLACVGGNTQVVDAHSIVREQVNLLARNHGDAHLIRLDVANLGLDGGRASSGRNKLAIGHSAHRGVAQHILHVGSLNNCIQLIASSEREGDRISHISLGRSRFQLKRCQRQGSLEVVHAKLIETIAPLRAARNAVELHIALGHCGELKHLIIGEACQRLSLNRDNGLAVGQVTIGIHFIANKNVEGLAISTLPHNAHSIEGHALAQVNNPCLRIAVLRFPACAADVTINRSGSVARCGLSSLIQGQIGLAECCHHRHSSKN